MTAPTTPTNPATDTGAERLYSGVWKLLHRYLHVPTEPLRLSGRDEMSFKPSPAFEKYLQAQVWLVFGIVFLATFIFLIAITFAEPIAGIIITLVVLPIEVLIGLVLLVATKFQFDSTWYALTDRAARIRRGVWVINETTVTFENVQNVRVEQGPLERYFNLSRVMIETAGANSSGGKNPQLAASRAVIQGVENAEELRDRILCRVREATGAGLGDDDDEGDGRRETGGHLRTAPAAQGSGLTAAHVDALRAIREELRLFRDAGEGASK